MPYTKLTLTIPEKTWLGHLSRRLPDLRIRVLSAIANDEAGYYRVELLGESAGPAAEELSAIETVTEATVFESAPKRRRVQVETTEPVLLFAMQDSGVPLQLPLEIANGELTFEATLSQCQLSKLSESLKRFDISFQIDCIQQDHNKEQLLTDRQKWLLHEAIDSGYYDTPRQVSLVELADKLGLAKSTLSETLHRAEGRVLKQFVNGDCEHQPDVSIRAEQT